MVTVTKKAAAEVKKLLTTRELAMNTKLRVAVERAPQPEKGVRLYLAFDSRLTSPNDEVHTSEGIEVVMEKDLAQYLKDAQIDYIQHGTEEGNFVFRKAEAESEPES